MDFNKVINRGQVTFFTVELQIEENNPVWFVDAFVDHLDLIQSGFLIKTNKTVLQFLI